MPCCGEVQACCDDGIPCTVDTCDDVTGSCTNTPDNTLCDDFDHCTDNTCAPTDETRDEDGCVYSFNCLNGIFCCTLCTTCDTTSRDCVPVANNTDPNDDCGPRICCNGECADCCDSNESNCLTVFGYDDECINCQVNQCVGINENGDCTPDGSTEGFCADGFCNACKPNGEFCDEDNQCCSDFCDTFINECATP
jgi:hypothetical protein